MHPEPSARLSRRAFVQAAAAGAWASCQRPGAPSDGPPGRAAVGFVSHGAPTLALDREKGRDLRAWAESMAPPRALLVVSAHWEEAPVALGAPEPTDLIYDFGGFDPRLFELEYRAPGAPWLAERVSSLLGGAPTRATRGWDHGVWVPLLHMYPAADVPLLQLSLPSAWSPRRLFELGRSLRPLRDEGVLLLGSGGLVHNLGALDWSRAGPVPGWAADFEAWARDALRRHDVDALLDFERRAPALSRAHPTHEHLLPLLVALGASDGSDAVSFPVVGFEYGSLSRTAVQLG
ncbi:MAG: class III extradiol ring-cleavage dioxygenase [Planctomycetota bacterium]